MFTRFLYPKTAVNGAKVNCFDLISVMADFSMHAAIICVLIKRPHLHVYRFLKCEVGFPVESQ